MKKLLLAFICFFGLQLSSAQELLADVKVDYSAIQNSNNQVYKTLESSLKNFINQTQWTDKKYEVHERIQCVFYFIITEKTSNRFKGSLTIQSQRPIYNSDKQTPIINFQDTNIEFDYTEFEQLVFDSRRFSGKNLTDLIGFYIYFILGYDADSFSNLGGTTYFETSQKIAQSSENQGFKGWSTFDGIKARTTIINDLLKPTANTLREINYLYHIKGLDTFYTNELNSKNNIANTLIRLQTYQNMLQFFPIDIFMSAKKGEIASIFSGGIPISNNFPTLKQTLETIAPTDKEQLWDKMKN